MNAKQRSEGQRIDRKDRNDGKHEPNKAPPHAGVGSETAQKGGKEPAQRQAEHDWENSPKESGE